MTGSVDTGSREENASKQKYRIRLWHWSMPLNLPAALNLVEPLDRQTLGERAYAQLADLLISGRLAPGEKLSLRASADVLGVSIMPVREAVSRLVADRALGVAPNRAVRVPLMSAAQ